MSGQPRSYLSGSQCKSSSIYTNQVLYTGTVYELRIDYPMGTCPYVLSSFSTSSETGIRMRYTAYLSNYFWIV